MTSKQSLVLRLTARPRALADVRPNVPWPARLQVALDRALAPEPKDRFRTVAELAAVVRAAVGAPNASGSATQMMTPLSVEAVPTRTITPRPAPAARRRSWRGPLIAAGLMLATVGTLLAKPPAALREFLEVYDVQLPRANAGQPTTRPAATDSVTQAGAALEPHPTDSTAAVRPLGDSAARPLLGDDLSPLGSRHAAMHLGAVGDSGATTGAPGTQTAELDAKEVLMHVTRAKELSRLRQLKGAGMELRTAYEEYRIFLTEHAAAPQTGMLRQELQVAMDESLNACRVARDSVMARGEPGFRCQHPAKTGILMDDSEEGIAAAAAAAAAARRAAAPVVTEPEPAPAP
jgi:hypothetical protein